MGERYRITRLLVDHFFRRFFDNDTIQADGDTRTTVVRALTIVAVPNLTAAFLLQMVYFAKPLERPQWRVIEDHYLFVVFSFVIMGAVSIFEWEMLFPDRLDFQVLSPLSLKPVQMLAAKALALIGFLALFLVACNIFGILILPAISRLDFFRQVYAHAVAVLLEGVFAALLFLAVGGILVCLLGATRFRKISPIVQILSVTGLLFLMLSSVAYLDSMEALLSVPLGLLRWLPPLWFLGVYEQLLQGVAAPPFAREMTRYAFRGTAIVAMVVLITYPMAWARMQKMAVEGAGRGRRQPLRFWAWLLHRVIRLPEERALFHFIGQTIARNNRYQVFLAMYWGTGLALALSFATNQASAGGKIHWTLSPRGLHAVMPLLLFWVIAGLRAAFAFPLNLSAGWIFRITGVRISECVSAARKWTFLCAMSVLCSILTTLRLAGWDAGQLLGQAVCGFCLCILLTDGFFLFQHSIPFNQPRMPGRTNLFLMLSFYFGILPPAILGAVSIEMAIQRHMLTILSVILPTALFHVVFKALSNRPEEVEEEMEGYEGEFQILDLS